MAGSTIFFGLPIGRVQNASMSLKVMLSATATGILLFLLYDVLADGVEPVDAALKSGRPPTTARGATSPARARCFALGFGAGLLSLVDYDRWMARERAKACSGRAQLGSGVRAVVDPRSLSARAGSRC